MGLRGLTAVKTEPSVRHVHVILLASGGVWPEERANAENMGAIFRLKPTAFAEVVQLAGDILELCKNRNLATVEITS
jgi:hypothetical protein